LPTDPAPRSHFWPLIWVVSAWRTHLGLLAFLLALGLTWGGLWLDGRAFMGVQPARSEVRRVQVLSASAHSVVPVLQVEIEASHSPNCTRMSQNVLYRQERDSTVVYLLGLSITGDGLGTAWPSATEHGFLLNLPIPSAIPEGEYEYSYRSVYLCSWLGGFLQRRVSFDSPPVPVRVGPP
jgi:hypothetical protein